MRVTPLSVLAVCNLRFVRVEFQPDLGQPIRDRRTHIVGLTFAVAVHNQVSSRAESHRPALAE